MIEQKNKFDLKSLLKLILFSISGILLGSSVGLIVINLYINSWTLLDSPIKFNHIVVVDDFEVFAQTAGGVIYFRESDTCPRLECKQWIKAKFVPSHSSNQREKGSCPFDNNSIPQKPSGNIVECVRSNVLGNFSTVYYALMDDGTIRAWRSELGSKIFISTLIAVSFAFLGLVLAIIAYLIFTPSIDIRKIYGI